MSHNSDSGHAKNVSKFYDLITICASQGANYNPSKDALSIAKLKELHTAALDSLNQSNTLQVTYDKAVHTRQLAFRDFKSFARQLVNALSASGASDLVVADVKAIIRKIDGARAKAIEKAEGKTSGVAPSTDASNAVDSTNGTGSQNPSDKTISVAQMSFDNQIEHFSKLIEVLSQDAQYKPNEEALKITSLKAKLEAMKLANIGVIHAYTPWSNARIIRDNILYNQVSGVVPTVSSVKKYVKSLYGVSSPQYKQLSKMLFKAVTL